MLVDNQTNLVTANRDKETKPSVDCAWVLAWHPEGVPGEQLLPGAAGAGLGQLLTCPPGAGTWQQKDFAQKRQMRSTFHW